MFPELGTAFLAGALALLSPCAAPILPGIVGALTSTGNGRARPSRQVWSILAFAVGAALVLIGSVALLLAFGANVNLARPPYTFIAGGLLIGAGLYSLGVLRIPWITKTSTPGGSVAKALLLGVSCAAVWYPCLGPSLAIAYGLASNIDTVGLGVALGFVYFLGMLTPLFLLGLVLARAARSRRWLRRIGAYANKAVAVLLIAIGVLVITGLWNSVSLWIVDNSSWFPTL
ncbi:cytochrome c biogenesis CcdA family protein [Rathayibacter sp. AY1A7]|uniref:cytochrome c biogenesis CcdA family protein n=1 Tax=Rathayibacter sp. AY1A7 TaxID=2080524 RepID=UPI000CE7EF32|nr:cytochrome c biogenesis protein CcdA [Rathayibacter sp. AY1A7]PPF14950.1 hypothetical protein C5B95_16660 [Rathayibacter sp. AY1A7]